MFEYIYYVLELDQLVIFVSDYPKMNWDMKNDYPVNNIFYIGEL